MPQPPSNPDAIDRLVLDLKEAARYLAQNGQTKASFAVLACITMLEDDSEIEPTPVPERKSMNLNFITGMALGLFVAQWCIGFFLYDYGVWGSVFFGILNVIIYAIISFIYNRFVDP